MNRPVSRMQPRGNHREREILDEVRLAGGAARIHFLAERLGVSEETIRRNVKALEAGGQVHKVHGGVYLAEPQDEEPFRQRMDENPDAKRRIAAEVASIVRDGDSLFLDIGWRIRWPRATPTACSWPAANCAVMTAAPSVPAPSISCAASPCATRCSPSAPSTPTAASCCTTCRRRSSPAP